MKYYEFNDIPAKWDGKGGTIPELLVNGVWTLYYQLDKFWSEAREVDKQTWDELVAQAQAGGES